MRLTFAAAVSAAALLGAALPASAAPFAPAAAVQSDEISDAELSQFAAAMDSVGSINANVDNGAPTAEQQAAMAAAIQTAGLDIVRFNAISTAVSADPVVRARVAVQAAPAPAAGSVAAGVSDAEVDQFAVAMSKVRPISEALNGAAPSADQQAAMAAAITGTGLALERFNAISGAVSHDERLRARLALSDARRAG